MNNKRLAVDFLLTQGYEFHNPPDNAPGQEHIFTRKALAYLYNKTNLTAAAVSNDGNIQLYKPACKPDEKPRHDTLDAA